MSTATVSPGLSALRSERKRVLEEAWKPRERLTVWEHADQYRIVPEGTSPEPGPWVTDRVPYTRAIMEAFSRDDVELVVTQKPAQAAMTDVLVNVCLYYIDHEPSPILVVQPNVEPMAKKFSKTRLAPTISASPTLASLMADPKSRDSHNTIMEKVFPGGHISIIGANAPAALASTPIRILLFDEVDKFPESAGTEGDPVDLGWMRTSNFPNRKIGMVSTPALKGSSRIEQAMRDTVRHFYIVPCLHCGAQQRLRWRNKAKDYCLIFERNSHGEITDVGYACQYCGVIIEEVEKFDMAAAGEWWHDPTVKREGDWWDVTEKDLTPGLRWSEHMGFQIDIFYTPWREWISICRKFLEGKDDPEKLQVFVNATLGEPFDPHLEHRTDPETLKARRLAQVPEWDVPDGAGVVTMAVDVQDDRLEYELAFWGTGQEVWKRHHRLYGDPEHDEVWDRLFAAITQPYRHELGTDLRVRACAIDSGFKAEKVYTFCRKHRRLGVIPIKGLGGRGVPIIGKPAKRPGRYGVKIFPVGTDTTKDKLFARLKITELGPGYLHFIGPTDTGTDGEYFDQFANEIPRWRMALGQRVKRWELIRDNARNEAIDLGVYNFAALYWLGATIHEKLERWVQRTRDDAKRPSQKPPTKPVRRPKRQSNWVTDW